MVMEQYKNFLNIGLVLDINNLKIAWGYKSGGFSSATITYPISFSSFAVCVYTKNSNRAGASYDNESFILSKPGLTNFKAASKYGNGGTYIVIGS